MPATTRTIAAALVLLLAGLCLAAPRADLRPVPAGTTPLVSGAPLQRADVDTVFLLGDPRNAAQSPQHNGTFEDADGTPDWAGWTSWNGHDVPSDPRWQISEFQALAGQYSMWCGDHFDGDPGYGNNWNTALLFTHTVADPGVASTVHWTAQLRVDTEPGYDFVHLEWRNGDAWWPLQQYDGARFHVVDETITYEPGQYAGDQQDEVQLRVRFTSDEVWSDEDGLWLTDGACQYDDVRVLVNGVEVDYEDFEDGVSQRWSEARATDYWDFDFARLWTDLADLDPCVDNPSPQVAFIDTGEQSIHTDGTPCITWCYGPGGYIAYNSNAWGNPSGYPLDNAVISPVLEWPAGCDAAQLDFTAYLHEDLGPMSPQVFVRWHVRSVDTGHADDLTAAEWRSRNYLYFGGPEYRRMQFDVSDLLEPGRTHVQVILQAWQFEFWGWWGADGTPAPYFDNVQLKAYPRPEPVITAMADHLFHDAVPTTGVVDLDNLAANSVRLDASRVTNEGVPVDSIQVDIAVLRPDAVLAEPARLHVRMLANPLFDAVRQLPAGFTQAGAVVTGSVAGAADAAQATRVRFDLPDQGFFFPGDVIRCYVRAVSEVDGVLHPAILPADTAGFGSDQRHAGYCEAFEVRALPSLANANGAQPRILFWQHGHGDQGQRWWLDTFAEAGRHLGVDVDLYASNAPGLEDADGLGGRVPASALAGYDILVYAAGRLRTGLSAHPEWNDVAVLTEWIEQGSKRILLTGDNVMRNLDGGAFMADYLGAVFEADDVAPLIGQQQSPLVLVPASGPIWRPSLEGWLVDGGCPEPRQIDAVTPGPGAATFAGFADPSGAPDAYPYTAGWYQPNPVHDTLAVGLPYDLSAVIAAPGFPVPPGQSAAAVLLDDILDHLGGIISDVGSVPATSLAVHCFPNPFNPAVTIRLAVPRAARATVDIVDVRGRHVRRILHANLVAGSHDLTWDGADDRGRAAASGVYFARVRVGEASRLGKLMLVR